MNQLWRYDTDDDPNDGDLRGHIARRHDQLNRAFRAYTSTPLLVLGGVCSREQFVSHALNSDTVNALVYNSDAKWFILGYANQGCSLTMSSPFQIIADGGLLDAVLLRSTTFVSVSCRVNLLVESFQLFVSHLMSVLSRVGVHNIHNGDRTKTVLFGVTASVKDYRLSSKYVLMALYVPVETVRNVLQQVNLSVIDAIRTVHNWIQQDKATLAQVSRVFLCDVVPTPSFTHYEGVNIPEEISLTLQTIGVPLWLPPRSNVVGQVDFSTSKWSLGGPLYAVSPVMFSQTVNATHKKKDKTYLPVLYGWIDFEDRVLISGV